MKNTVVCVQLQLQWIKSVCVCIVDFGEDVCGLWILVKVCVVDFGEGVCVCAVAVCVGENGCVYSMKMGVCREFG